MFLTPHFTLEEACFTETGLANEPSEMQLLNIELTAVHMEMVRAILGGIPIRVNSWFRSFDVNAAINGAETSDHTDGWALDFIRQGQAPRETFEVLREFLVNSNYPFDQIIRYNTHVHISFARRFRRQVIRNV